MALRTCVERGCATTVATIPGAARMTREDALATSPTVNDAHGDATEDAVVLATIEGILHAIADTLARDVSDVGALAALQVATTDVLAGIAAGDGVIPRERLTTVAHVLTATPRLRNASRVLRFQILVPALAQRLGVTGDDHAVQHAVTVWSAVVAAAYNPAHRAEGEVDPSRDGRLPDVMADRLRDTFIRIAGRPAMRLPPNEPSDQ